MNKRKMHIAVNALSISLLTALSLTLAGCGDKTTGNQQTEAATAMAKDLTLKEKFSETKRKAEAGDAGAQVLLGTMYAFGAGIQKDSAKAVGWYQKAAVQGNADAQIFLGLMYGDGVGVPKDSAKAAEWYQQAAAQGDARAQFDLGWIYWTGKGVPVDLAKTTGWWQKAAAQGHAEAQYLLGLMYRVGHGVSKNHVLAYAWFNLSAAQGHDSARKLRDRLEKELTPAQLAEGQRLATNWKKGEPL